ncbi:MAG: ferritin family protein [Desulfobacteraceae bacterium]|nr:ferritin family protein [Desulfobacteraceae bacterium]
MDRNTYENILNRAIRSEIEANRFYHQVAQKMNDRTLKQMFVTFAGEELNHMKILESFRDKKDMAVHFKKVPDFYVADTLEEPDLSIDMKPAEAIALAMKKEQAAMKHYTQLAEACTDQEQRKLFLELASMEKDHKHKMEQAFVDIGYPEVW